MLTVFSIPKAFTGHIGIIQRNAIRSWMLLHAEVEIILLGNDEGTAEVAREFGLRHEPKIERNEFGSYLVNSAFAKAQAMARHEVVCYVNCDVMLMEDFRRAVQQVAEAECEFLMVGRRWDVNISEAWAFGKANWQTELRNLALRGGKQRGPDWIDYFAFSRGLYGADVPPFAIGRTCWDDWLVWKAIDSKKTVVDASPVVMAVHQNHDYKHHPGGAQGVWHGEEAGQNSQLAGGWDRLRTVADATAMLQPQGLRKNTARVGAAARRAVESGWRFLLYRAWHPVWFKALGISRPLRSALGLRAADMRRSRDKG
jgi:hypothetical protein